MNAWEGVMAIRKDSRARVMAAATIVLFAVAKAQAPVGDSAQPEIPTAEQARYESALKWLTTLEFPGPGHWEFLFFSADYRSAHFATRRMSTRKAEIATVWFRLEKRDPSEIGSVASRMEFDCANQTMRTLTDVTYTEGNLGGESKEFDGPPKPSPILPGTQSETLIEWACKHSKPAPGPKPKSPPAKETAK
jgi:hypothetical protein